MLRIRWAVLWENSKLIERFDFNCWLVSERVQALLWLKKQISISEREELDLALHIIVCENIKTKIDIYSKEIKTLAYDVDMIGVKWFLLN